MLTINPNNESGNIFYTKKYIEEKNESFLSDYKRFLTEEMNTINEKLSNSKFVVFNKKIEKLIKNNKSCNIVSEYNYEVTKKLNDKKYSRKLFEKDINIIDTIWVDKNIDYDEAKNMIGSDTFVIQGKVGSGGDNTFYVDSKDKFNKYSSLNDGGYFISKYISHLPINTTIILNDYNDVYLPSSVQLIELKKDKFKYVGADFVYYQQLNSDLKNKVNEYNKIIVKKLKKLGYKGILGVDYIIDEDDNIYFMEINPRFQSSSFIISKNLEKYCSTSIAELHYYAITDKYIGNTYLDKINCSFLNCYNKYDYNFFSHFKIIRNGYYKLNKQTYFRKIYNYSLLKYYNFEKRNKDI